MNRVETLAEELKRLIGEYQDDDAGESTKAEAWNLIADFTVENSKAILGSLSTPIAAGGGEATQVKLIATKFFRWWWNQPGANTDQGYDEWAETEGAPLLAAPPSIVGEG